MGHSGRICVDVAQYLRKAICVICRRSLRSTTRQHCRRFRTALCAVVFGSAPVFAEALALPVLKLYYLLKEVIDKT
ncbi:hypothetical protein L596_028967 [Steinernema carpocapsae]|uniref:Uncharacterized protein n=1 Tax=Steinernema carpocapsae TaxID=34508 RepID=A0A4U5LT90_STECR|nr:hypothetical protein L596_028967 [Steinernema carpocapsae]